VHAQCSNSDTQAALADMLNCMKGNVNEVVLWIACTYHVMLSCEIITALGGPVVPLVYINVQQLPGSCAPILSSTVLSDTSYSQQLSNNTYT
jgi:hypothetical protein